MEEKNDGQRFEKAISMKEYRSLIFKAFIIGSMPTAYANSISWNFVRLLYPNMGITFASTIATIYSQNSK